MEAIIVIVGFLGAGKTTLLKRLVNDYLYSHWDPYVILNDYQNAQMDAQFFSELISSKSINAISGSCICCDGINELRSRVNEIPKREKGITFIEANGTTDANTLMGFLGVGLKERFLPPVQIAVVDARNWQKREHDNELEANQVQVSSFVILNYAKEVSGDRRNEVAEEIRKLNPAAQIANWEDLNSEVLRTLKPSLNAAMKMDHHKSHWSSCSVDLPEPMKLEDINKLIERIPKTVLRVKGCTKLDSDSDYTFFERTPTGEIFKRPFYGNLVSGPKLLLIGPGSDPAEIKSLIHGVQGITKKV